MPALVWTGILPVLSCSWAARKNSVGNLDHLPKQAFLYCGGLDDVNEKVKKLASA